MPKKSMTYLLICINGGNTGNTIFPLKPQGILIQFVLIRNLANIYMSRLPEVIES